MLVLISGLLYAQEKSYTLKQLTQAPVVRTRVPQPTSPKTSGDTSFIMYANSSVDMKLYFVKGETHYRDPNPAGLYLNGQHFRLFCDVNLWYKQSVSSIADVYEFKYLDRNYLCTFTLMEIASGVSRYKCYNLFDITDPKHIVQTSFSSIHQGEDSFGDFNRDGKIDFVRVVPKLPESTKKIPGDMYMINVYTLEEGKPVLLQNARSMPYYIFATGNDNIASFEVVQHGWMLPLKDASGAQIAAVDYYEKYERFDPENEHLYGLDGSRVKKKTWTLVMGAFADLSAAQFMCEQMSRHKFDELYIMTNNFWGETVFQVFYGNFDTREEAETEKIKLKSYGIKSMVHNWKVNDF